MSKKKIIILSIIFLLILVCLYISLSYSYYMIGNKVVEIETAMETPDCVGITTSGKAFSLNKDYAVPITNSQFLNSKKETQDIYKYSFTINNSCQNMDLNGLEIGLVPLEGSNISISNLKYILIKTKDNSNSFTEDNINSFSDEDVKKLPKGMIQELRNSYDEQATNVYPVGLASFEGENSVSYDLYVWLGSEADNDTMNSEFKAAVVVYKDNTPVDPQLQILLNTPVGVEGKLMMHSNDLATGAKDGGYRYSGNQPNNYICFGNGSENYNKGTEGAECKVGNKYRIIGFVPVTLEDGTEANRLKVIKAEYLTEEEFETPDGTTSSTDAQNVKRIENTDDTVAGYHWNDDGKNVWEESSLYLSLKSSYLNKNFDSTWNSKIETVTWNAGGATEYKITPKAMYQEEMKTQGPTAPVISQVGLMYAYDYGFAYGGSDWSTTIYEYNTEDTKKNNWLYNGVNEWTISRRPSNNSNVYRIDYIGALNRDSVSEFTYAVRPVFYLTTDTVLDNSNGADGSREHPLKVSL